MVIIAIATIVALTLIATELNIMSFKKDISKDTLISVLGIICVIAIYSLIVVTVLVISGVL